jgi:hypothetical protein
MPSGRPPCRRAGGQLLVDDRLVGPALVGQPAGTHDRAAEPHAAARVEGGHTDQDVPAGRISGTGGVGAGQDEAPNRSRHPEHLPNLREGGQLAPLLGQVIGWIVGPNLECGVHRLVGGQETGQRRLRPAGAGGRCQHQRPRQADQQREGQARADPAAKLRPGPHP